MIPTKQQFQEFLNGKGDFSIVFLGMSGVGKSRWAKKFYKEFGIKHIEIDDLIGKSDELVDLIKDIAGESEVEKVGKYFGFPWSDSYQEKEDIYLNIEKQLMKLPFPKGSVIDLTGSAIYHSDELGELAKDNFMIHLSVSKEKQQKMFEIFIGDPKPVCWSGMFSMKDEEATHEALERCYPLLLDEREKLYADFADVTISYNKCENLEGFVKEIKSRI